MEQPIKDAPRETSIENFIKLKPPSIPEGFNGSFTECGFDPSKYSDSLFSQLDIPIPVQIAGSVTKRKAEFLAGRYCAKAALSELGYFHTPVAIGHNRCPAWPAGISGSISHSENRAVCVVSRNFQGVGIDITHKIPGKIISEINTSILNKNEEDICKSYADPTQDGVTLIFSMKEALFKALYPQVKKYFDFLDVEVVAIDPKKQKIQLRLIRDLSEKLGAGTEFIGSYWKTGECFYSLLEYGPR
ncbi:4'-phosphopantetheinyl transferase family protein [Microbulbifer hainanensis]|uniref:4'-phosphopantetheinyl transferase family protein n=1 Tax=Microbulbifer hainanensis TaxID=2735675 RepID=UPI0018664887|nr:4'-phosphopantetheinyl transferase superfamily protein [Microbulbifer hainanensis]